MQDLSPKPLPKGKWALIILLDLFIITIPFNFYEGLLSPDIYKIIILSIFFGIIIKILYMGFTILTGIFFEDRASYDQMNRDPNWKPYDRTTDILTLFIFTYEGFGIIALVYLVLITLDFSRGQK